MGYFRLKGYKDDQGLQENKGGYKGFQEVTRGNRGLQWITGVSREKLNSNHHLII